MSKTFIIAEAGVNHNGSMEMAMELINTAVTSGADAVKFQTFRADSLVTESAPKANYQLDNTNQAESQYKMLKALELSKADHDKLMAHAAQKKIQFLSTPFDLESLSLLTKTFNLPIIKIASGEITNSPMLLAVARTQKPVIVSTGMANLGDIEMALSVLAFGYLDNREARPSLQQFMDAYRSTAGQKKLYEKVTLLHCTTEYPVPFAEVNLKVLDTLKAAFNLPVGYSDHTQGIEIAIAAVARGATVIEKHFTLNKNLPGPDHKASLEPQELASMVSSIRHVEAALGHGQKIPTPAEYINRAIARKSLVALKNIAAGEVFTEANLGLKRPGSGVSGIYYWEWLGKVSATSYQPNELITDL
ncbi:MAG: N-acetylneuraminate synthase [Pseudomonadota bacterium]